MPEQGGLLLGFDVASDETKILAVRPIFITAKGQITGRWCGANTANVKPKRVLAKPGYAVGAINVKASLGIDGLSLVFMEIDSDGLNPATSYQSNWFGRAGVAQFAMLSSGEGAATIGIQGNFDGKN